MNWLLKKDIKYYFIISIGSPFNFNFIRHTLSHFEEKLLINNVIQTLFVFEYLDVRVLGHLLNVANEKQTNSRTGVILLVKKLSLDITIQP